MESTMKNQHETRDQVSNAGNGMHMVRHELFNDGKRSWVFFGRDPLKGENLIDTNEYLVMHNGKGMLLDPGGMEIFPSVVTAVSKELEMKDIEIIFASHQDPDIISSLALWINLNPDIDVYSSWVWGSFIPHFGGGQALKAIPDEGMNFHLGGSSDLQAIPAHYLHSSGNFSVYDPTAKILFSGDIGASLLPPDYSDVFIRDFDEYIPYAEGFHRRWMPSDRAKRDWIERVSRLDIEYMCPQHGAILPRQQVERFLHWFNDLEVGSAIGSGEQ